MYADLLRDHDFDDVYTLSGVPLGHPVVNIEGLQYWRGWPRQRAHGTTRER